MDEKDRHIRELQDQLRKATRSPQQPWLPPLSGVCTQVTQEKDSLLKAQLSAAQLALDHVSIGPQPYDLYRKEYAGSLRSDASCSAEACCRRLLDETSIRILHGLQTLVRDNQSNSPDACYRLEYSKPCATFRSYSLECPGGFYVRTPYK